MVQKLVWTGAGVGLLVVYAAVAVGTYHMMSVVWRQWDDASNLKEWTIATYRIEQRICAPNATDVHELAADMVAACQETRRVLETVWWLPWGYMRLVLEKVFHEELRRISNLFWWTTFVLGYVCMLQSPGQVLAFVTTWVAVLQGLLGCGTCQCLRRLYRLHHQSQHQGSQGIQGSQGAQDTLNLVDGVKHVIHYMPAPLESSNDFKRDVLAGSSTVGSLRRLHWGPRSQRTAF